MPLALTLGLKFSLAGLAVSAPPLSPSQALKLRTLLDIEGVK